MLQANQAYMAQMWLLTAQGSLEVFYSQVCVLSEHLTTFGPVTPDTVSQVLIHH